MIELCTKLEIYIYVHPLRRYRRRQKCRN